MQPSSVSRRRRSELSTVRSRRPFTSTTIDSSPNCLWKRSVALAAADERPTSESVLALGSSWSARTTPASASAPTTAIVTSGRRVTARATRPKNSRPLKTRFRLGHGQDCSAGCGARAPYRPRVASAQRGRPRQARGGLLHPERAARLAREELPHELVVRVEELLRRPGLDDPSLPEDRDVLGHA